MKSELDKNIEITHMLYRFCLTVRGMKKKPELAGAAAEREMQFKRELEELEAEKARLETPELALRGQHHEEAA